VWKEEARLMRPVMKSQPVRSLSSACHHLGKLSEIHECWHVPLPKHVNVDQGDWSLRRQPYLSSYPLVSSRPYMLQLLLEEASTATTTHVAAGRKNS
jgi:hypothetical protein